MTDTIVTTGFLFNKLVDVLFAPTVTARMLRCLVRRGSMPQAEFMREYHRRSERPNGGKSAFDNNFGKYLVDGRWGHTSIPLIVKTPKHNRYLRRNAAARKTLCWTPIGDLPCNVDMLLARMTSQQLQMAYERMERELTVDGRDSDDVEETMWWVNLLESAAVGRLNANQHLAK